MAASACALIWSADELIEAFAVGRAAGARQLQGSRHLPREIRRARAPHRGADFRRRPRPCGRAGRTRLFGAAAQPEGHRGNPGARPHRCQRSSLLATAVRLGEAVELPLRRHGRIRLRHAERRILFPRSEHAPAGRARRHRGSHRRRSGRMDGARGRRRTGSGRASQGRTPRVRRCRCAFTPRTRARTSSPPPAC